MGRIQTVFALAGFVAAGVICGCSKQEESPPPAINSPGAAPGPSGPAPAPSISAQNKPAAASADSAVTAKVKNALMTAKEPLPWKAIEVETSAGTVHLKGEVSNVKQKDQAGTLAKQAAGADHQVMNMLTVKGAK